VLASKGKSVNMKFIILVALVSFGYGVLSAVYEIFPYSTIRAGYRWSRARLTTEKQPGAFENIGEGFWNVARQASDDSLSSERKAAIAKLASLPYLSGTNAAGDVENVTIYDKALAGDGYNFFVSGHGPEAYLTDMEGKVLHKWRYPFADIWPEKLPFDEWNLHKTFWRKAHLYPNGDVLAIFEGIGIIKVDSQSKLIWADQNRSHHDLFVDRSGMIYTLTRKWREKHPSLKMDGKFLEDFITVLTPEGKMAWEVSVVDCILNSDFASLLVTMTSHGDILHTNTVEVMDGKLAARYPMFKKGNVLISMPMLHSIAVVDPKTRKVVWAMTGMWIYQHQPTVLANGHILLFDNMGEHGKSKVVEFDPLTQEVTWAYRSTPEHEFLSRTCGSNQRLANGNTLITETNGGRAFEVTPDNKIVWEFVNPFRAGEHKELVASLFDLVRVEPNFFSGETWLAQSEATDGHGAN